jgi:histidinol-phosphatase
VPRRPDPLRVALAAAEAAGGTALRAFGRRMRVETKRDATPVTEHDRAGEEAARRIIARAFPDDAILGEEFGETGGGGPCRWIVDPIDGTKSFIRGVPFWGTLVARERDGRVDVGVIFLPALGLRLWAARGRGAFLNGRRVRVSRTARLRGAHLLHGETDRFVQRGSLSRLAALARAGAVLRPFGDCAAYVWIASGRAEGTVEALVSPWDVAAPKVVIEEAGGRLTGWGGEDTHRISRSVASNGRLHSAILRRLRR